MASAERTKLTSISGKTSTNRCTISAIVIGRMEIAAYAVIVSQTYVFVNDGVWMVGCGQHGKQFRTYDGDSAESKSFRGTSYKRPVGTELKVALGLATADAESDEVAVATVR